MKTYTLITLLILSILIIGCTSEESPQASQEEVESLCREPYIEYKVGDCCLDANNNRICDNDEIQKEVEEPTIEPEIRKTHTLEDIQNKLNELREIEYEFKIEEKEEFKHYISNEQKDFVIITVQDPKYFLNSFEDLTYLKDILITEALEKAKEITMDWIAIENEGLDRRKDPRDYEIVTNLFVDEKEVVDSKVLNLVFVNRVLFKRTLIKLYLENYILAPCGKETILIQKIRSSKKGDLYLGHEIKDSLKAIKNGAEEIYQENIAEIEQVQNFCGQMFDKEFYSTQIMSEEREEIMKTEDYKYSIEMKIIKGVPSDVESTYLKMLKDKENGIYYKFVNKGIILEEPYVLVNVTFDGGEEVSSKQLEALNKEQVYENYIPIPEDAENIQVRAAIYKRWTLEEAYIEKTVHFD